MVGAAEFVVEKLDPSGVVWLPTQEKHPEYTQAADQAREQTCLFSTRTRVIRRVVEAEFQVGAVEVAR